MDHGGGEVARFPHGLARCDVIRVRRLLIGGKKIMDTVLFSGTIGLSCMKCLDSVRKIRRLAGTCLAVLGSIPAELKNNETKNKYYLALYLLLLILISTFAP
jgi:hypothetical protein